MTSGLSPTARGLRLIRATRSPRITLPPPTGNQPVLLATEANEHIITESGAGIIMETA